MKNLYMGKFISLMLHYRIYVFNCYLLKGQSFELAEVDHESMNGIYIYYHYNCVALRERNLIPFLFIKEFFIDCIVSKKLYTNFDLVNLIIIFCFQLFI